MPRESEGRICNFPLPFLLPTPGIGVTSIVHNVKLLLAIGAKPRNCEGARRQSRSHYARGNFSVKNIVVVHAAGMPLQARDFTMGVAFVRWPTLGRDVIATGPKSVRQLIPDYAARWIVRRSRSRRLSGSCSPFMTHHSASPRVSFGSSRKADKNTIGTRGLMVFIVLAATMPF